MLSMKFSIWHKKRFWITQGEKKKWRREDYETGVLSTALSKTGIKKEILDVPCIVALLLALWQSPVLVNMWPTNEKATTLEEGRGFSVNHMGTFISVVFMLLLLKNSGKSLIGLNPTFSRNELWLLDNIHF